MGLDGSFSAVDFFCLGKEVVIVVVCLFLLICFFLNVCQLVLDLVFVEESGLYESFSTVFVGSFNSVDLVLQSFLLFLNPLLETAQFILEDCGSCLFNFASHTLFPLISLSALVTTLNGGLKVCYLSIKGDKVVESVLEAVREDIPIVAVSFGLVFSG